MSHEINTIHIGPSRHSPSAPEVSANTHTLHPTPTTTPHTLHPTLYTLHPPPNTLHPTLPFMPLSPISLVACIATCFIIPIPITVSVPIIITITMTMTDTAQQCLAVLRLIDFFITQL